jgi:hypothetical protein
MGYDVIYQDWLDKPTFGPASWWLDGVFWKEEVRPKPKLTDVTYKLVMVLYHTANAYTFQVLGGTKTRYNKEKGSTRGNDFFIEYTFPDNSSDSAQRYFREVFRAIEKAGSFGLALTSGHVGNGWETKFPQSIEDYFQRTTGMKSPFPNISGG